MVIFSFKIINSLTDINSHYASCWNFVTQKSEEATLYHTLEWNIIQEKFSDNRFGAILLFIENVPIGLFPFCLVTKFGIPISVSHSLIETPYGGPISIKIPNTFPLKKDTVITNLIDKFDMFGSKYLMSSFRTHPFFKVKNLNNNHHISEKSVSILRLDRPTDEIFKKIRRNHKRQIKKATNQKYIFHEGNLNDLPVFYDLLKETYNRLDAGSPPSFDWFNEVLSHFLGKGIFKLFFVNHSERIIGGALTICYNKKLTFWRGAWVESYLESGLSAFLYWELIKWANEKGCDFFDTLYSSKDSLSHFKKGFGCEEVPVYMATQKSNLLLVKSKLNSSLKKTL